MAPMKIKNTIAYTWFWIVVLVIIILAMGTFSYFVVSHKGDPSWDYRPVKSLPSVSPNAEYQKLPFPQHIRGKGGK